MSRAWATALVVLGAAVLVVEAPTAARDRKPPRIVAAALLDVNRNSRADRLRLTYTERIRHAVDRDGRYPFRLAGYRIRSVGAANGRTITLVLVERKAPDPKARPSIRYRRTSSQTVRDRAGNQAVRQVFRKTRPHGHAASASSPTPTPTPTTPTPTTPTPTDADGDGTPDARDCAPRDPAIHPGAADLPDLGFVDANCDGIDGTESDAVFVSPKGSDLNPGTKAKPKRDVQAAVDAIAAGKGTYALVAFGSYGHVRVGTSGVGIYGGYDPASWKRLDRYPNGLPLILGSPEGIFVSGAKNVVLQHVAVRGANAGPAERSAYGIRALDAGLELRRVVVVAGGGLAGAPGANGARGQFGARGQKGANGACDSDVKASGGAGGATPGGAGGKGGDGKYESRGGDGARSADGTPGGKGGEARRAFPEIGETGARGDAGRSGLSGDGGTSELPIGAATWQGHLGIPGTFGASGKGGGGGGAGGGQSGKFVRNGTGNGGGGGGAGGRGGAGGAGGRPGGGSFAVYLFSSKVVIGASSIAAGRGGAGGRGGDGGTGGAGGAGGQQNNTCFGEIGQGGAGGAGGAGGHGGGGGGGAGGPSVGVMNAGASTASLETGVTVTFADPGAGGAGGSGGPGDAGGKGATGIAAKVVRS